MVDDAGLGEPVGVHIDLPGEVQDTAGLVGRVDGGALGCHQVLGSEPLGVEFLRPREAVVVRCCIRHRGGGRGSGEGERAGQAAIPAGWTAREPATDLILQVRGLSVPKETP